ncbi:MAG: histidine phosphatase family protein [Cocleimonas sp.]|nr:histidine phosphatase family protein [Cocleimonas sp.]
MKQLYLARHAKSAWDTQAPNDFSRPLSKRGLKDAKRMGKKLAELEWNPQVILCSPAQRTRQTCDLLYQYAKLDADIKWKDELYAASTSALIKLLTHTPESITSVMMIAHNPAIEWLLLDLCHDVPAQANGKIVTTANIAKINVQGSWDNLQLGNSELEALLRPKEI